MNKQTAGIMIRRALSADAADLLALVRRAMAVYARHSGIETTLDSELETLVDMRIHIEQDHVLVAEQAGQLIGTVRLVRQDHDTAWFTRFAVSPDRQRAGIGQLLLQEAESCLRQSGCRQVLLHTALSNPSLVAFYQTRGFTLLETSYERGYPRGLFLKVLTVPDQTP